MSLFSNCVSCAALAGAVSICTYPSNATSVRTLAFLWMASTIGFALFRWKQMRRAWRNFQIHEQVESSKSLLKASFPILIYGLIITDNLPWKDVSTPLGAAVVLLGIAGAVEAVRGLTGKKSLVSIRR